MNRIICSGMLVLLCVTSGFCVRPVAFIGLTGEGAPAIEKRFTRLFLEHIAVMPEVEPLGGTEIDRLRERTGGRFSAAAIAPALGRSLGRFIADSTLLVWGRVRQCTVQPDRFWFIGSGIRGRIDVELTIYDFSNQRFVFFGDAMATTLEKKGLVLFGPVDRAIQVSAPQREEIIESLLKKSVFAAGSIIESMLFNEYIKKNPPKNGYVKKEIAGEAAPARKDQEPEYIEEEPVDFEDPLIEGPDATATLPPASSLPAAVPVAPPKSVPKPAKPTEAVVPDKDTETLAPDVPTETIAPVVPPDESIQK